MDTLYRSLTNKMMRLRVLARRQYVTNYGRAFAMPLVALCRNEGAAPSVSDLARTFSVTVPAATQMVRLLSRRGFVRIVKDVDDARVSRVEPTPEGRRIATEAEAGIDTFFHGLVDHLGEEDGRSLDRIMGEILAYVEGRDGDFGEAAR